MQFEKSFPKLSTSLLIIIFLLSLIMSPEIVNATVIEVTSSADSYFDAKYAHNNENNGLTTFLLIKDSGYRRRSVIKFDLSSIPSGSTVNEAKLSIYLYEIRGGSGKNVYAYRVTHDWVEGDNTNGVTYNEANHIDANHPAGCTDWTDGGEWTVDGATSSLVPTQLGWLEWTVTDIVKAWIENNQDNYGFIISSNEDIDFKFYSKEYSNAERHPILRIDYTPPPIVSATDSTGRVRDGFLTRESVYATGTGFMPGTSVNIYVVNDRAWTLGDKIPPDVSSDGMNTVTTDVSGNLGPVLIWPAPLTIGSYDVVFDADQCGTYCLGDAVDNPNHPGFSVVTFDTGSVAIGGFYIPADRLAILAPYLTLAFLIGIVTSVLLTRKRRKN